MMWSLAGAWRFPPECQMRGGKESGQRCGAWKERVFRPTLRCQSAQTKWKMMRIKKTTVGLCRAGKYSEIISVIQDTPSTEALTRKGSLDDSPLSCRSCCTLEISFNCRLLAFEHWTQRQNSPQSLLFCLIQCNLSAAPEAFGLTTLPSSN